MRQSPREAEAVYCDSCGARPWKHCTTRDGKVSARCHRPRERDFAWLRLQELRARGGGPTLDELREAPLAKAYRWRPAG